MTTRISQHMVDPAALPAIMAGLGIAAHEIGDYSWSARASKTGWLLCQAQEVSRSTYAALFEEIGVTYGPGDGSTTFNLPDGRGRALIGSGSGLMLELVTAANVDAANNWFAVASNTDKWMTGMKVRVSTTGVLPTGLVAATDYYVIRDTTATIKFATTLANALAGTVIDITAAGSGTHTVTHTLTTRAVGDKGGEEMHGLTTNELAAHSHTAYNASTGAGGSQITVASSGGTFASNNSTAPAGGSSLHNNMQPFIAANLFIFAGV